MQRTCLGNVIYFGFANGPFDKLEKLSADLNQCIEENTGIPPLLAIDQEGWGVNQLKTSYGRESAYLMGRQVGEDLRGVGVNTDLAPVVDVVVRPECPLRYRSFGDDPERVILCAREMIRGLHEKGIHAVLKHFPGLGDTEVDSHVGLPTGTPELRPFIALKEEADAIMVGHLMVPSIDPERCASLSPLIVTGLLREKIGFDKVIMTDSLVMKGALGNVATFEEAVDRLARVAVEAFLAGSDLLILAKLQWVGFQVSREQNIDLIAQVMNRFLKAVESGEISEERLDASIDRLLRMKSRR